jgi:hypothetical protein
MRGSDRSLVSAIRGPVTLITLGILFALNNFTPYQFHQTWPVLLIVFGLLTLMRRAIEPAPEPPPPGPIAYAPYNYSPAPPPPPTPASGGYRQSGYNEPAPPATPAKGGFGSTAKPDENEGGTV